MARLQSRLLSKPTAEQPLTLQQKQQRLRCAAMACSQCLRAQCLVNPQEKDVFP